MPKTIKALSLHQPWSSLVAIGAKRYETRSWAISHRGELLICSTKNFKAAMQGWNSSPIMQSALSLRGFKQWQELPFGQALALVYLEECLPTIKLGELFAKGQVKRFRTTNELHYGNYEAGRYAFKLSNIRPIKDPFPVTGRQGLFEVELPENFEAMLGRAF
jgi:hypothetical protein